MSRREKELEHEQTVFSCVLHGERRYLTEIRAYIANQYLSDGKIQSLDFAYSIDRLYTVSEREWKAYEDFPRKS